MKIYEISNCKLFIILTNITIVVVIYPMNDNVEKHEPPLHVINYDCVLNIVRNSTYVMMLPFLLDHKLPNPLIHFIPCDSRIPEIFFNLSGFI